MSATHFNDGHLRQEDPEYPREDGWQLIDTAPKRRKLIVGYRNSAGKWRSVMACYYPPGTLDSSEWNESEDGYANEGWYEESETQEMLLPTDCPPTHWMPLPKEPE